MMGTYITSRKLRGLRGYWSSLLAKCVRSPWYRENEWKWPKSLKFFCYHKLCDKDLFSERGLPQSIVETSKAKSLATADSFPIRGNSLNIVCNTTTYCSADYVTDGFLISSNVKLNLITSTISRWELTLTRLPIQIKKNSSSRWLTPSTIVQYRQELFSG